MKEDPVLRFGAYQGKDKEWQELVRWTIPSGRTGNLGQLYLKSNDDGKTKYKIVLGDQDQGIPVTNSLTTPFVRDFPANAIPGGKSCYIQIRSSDGTTITVEGAITGAEREK